MATGITASARAYMRAVEAFNVAVAAVMLNRESTQSVKLCDALADAGQLATEAGNVLAAALGQAEGSNAPDVALRLVHEWTDGTAKKDLESWGSEAATTLYRLIA